MSSMKAVTVGGEIHGVLWDAQVGAGAPVGTCECGGKVFGQPVRRWGAMRWYEAECRACGREVTSPNGKLAGRREPVPA